MSGHMNSTGITIKVTIAITIFSLLIISGLTINTYKVFIAIPIIAITITTSSKNAITMIYRPFYIGGGLDVIGNCVVDHLHPRRDPCSLVAVTDERVCITVGVVIHITKDTTKTTFQNRHFGHLTW